MNALSNIPAGYTEDGYFGNEDSRRRVIYFCEECGAPICEGDYYWDAGGGQVYHEVCLNILTVDKVRDLLGIVISRAGEYMGD